MIQLSYQPALDPFHTAFRALRLLPTIRPIGRLHRDHVRILDFYLLFPFRIEGMRFAHRHRRFRRIAQEFEFRKPYGEQPEDSLMFSRMEPMQHAALETLAEKTLIDTEEWRAGYVAPTDQPLADELRDRVQTANAAESDLIELITALALEYELLGQNGLKDRTGLLEHRYDAV
jgi:hypothetical protein